MELVWQLPQLKEASGTICRLVLEARVGDSVYTLPESRSKSAVTLCDGSVLAFSLVIMENFGPCQALFEVYRHHREQLHLFLQCSCFCFFCVQVKRGIKYGFGKTLLRLSTPLLISVSK